MPTALGLGLGLPFLGGGGVAPTFALNFLSMAVQGAFGTLDSRISFSRGSLATITRADGTVGWAGHNLLPFSTNFNAWEQFATITATGLPDPLGGNSATAVTVPSGGTLRLDFPFRPGDVGTFSVWVRRPSGSQATVRLTTNNTAAWNTGISVAAPIGPTWQRLTLTGVLISSGSVLRVLIGAVDVSGASDASSAGLIEVFGAQVNLGASAHPYYPTTGSAYHAPRFAFDPTGVTVTENYGPELVTNGDFAAGSTGWTANAGWTISGGQAIANTAGASALVSGSLGLVAGRTYRVRFTATVTSGNISSFLGGASARANFTSGTYEFFTQAGSANQFLSFDALNAFVGTIDNVSVREYLGATSTGTATPLGLLIEEQRTNSLTWSEAFDDAAWGKVGPDFVGPNAGIAPDGTPTADLFVHTTGRIQRSSVSLAVGSTLSLYVKHVSGSTVFSLDTAGGAPQDEVRFDLSTGAVLSLGSNNSAATITPAALGYWRVSVTRAVSASTIFYIGLGAPANTVLLWGAQLEADSFATTYIPTFGASATRAAEDASITGANFSSWFSQPAGTFVAGFRRPPGTGQVFITDNGTEFGVPRTALIRHNGGGSVSVGGTNTAVNTTLSAAVGGRVMAALAYTASPIEMAGTANGSAPRAVSNPDFTGVGTTRLLIGHGANGSLNGAVESLDYYPQHLPNETLRTLTGWVPPPPAPPAPPLSLDADALTLDADELTLVD